MTDSRRMTQEQFTEVVRRVALHAREFEDVHVLLIVLPRDESHPPFSAGTLDSRSQVHVLRAIADSIEKMHVREFTSEPL